MQLLANELDQGAAEGRAPAKRARLDGSSNTVESLHSVLMDDTSGGAVLIGPAGSGRRAAFDEVLGLLDPQPSVVHLNGTPYAAHMRHGVMAFLLSQLDTDRMSSRHELVHGLAELLCQRGQRSVVTLGNPQLIDAESAAILTQLAAMKKIRLVAVCERFAELPSDVLALYRSGQLHRVSAHSMDVLQTRTYLESELGGPISVFAAAALWHLTHSNRDLLRCLIRELVADGKLRLDGQCWILAPGALRLGAAVKSHGTRLLAGLKPGELRLLKLLALGGPVESAKLRRCKLSGDLVGLRARGLITVGEEPTGTVSITVPLLAHQLREPGDDDTQQELEDLLSQIHSDAVAARQLTEVRAMRELGNCEALVATVEEFADNGGFSTPSWQLDAPRRIRILEAQVNALCALGRHARAVDCLSQADVGIAAALNASPNDGRLIKARQLLRVMNARMALVAGHPMKVPALLAEKAAVNTAAVGSPYGEGTTGYARPVEGTAIGTVWATETLHFKALAVQAEAWALTSRQEEALLIVQRIMADLEGLRLTGILDQVMTAMECAVIESTLLRVQLVSGEWQAAAASARRLAHGQYPDANAIAYGELILGLLAGLSNESDTALGPLLPTLGQLAINADATELAAAEGAAAYCLADQDRDPEAVDLLLRAPSVVERMLPLNFFSWASEVFASLAVARLDSPQAAAVRLMALADKARRGGNLVFEMNSLAAAVSLGRTADAPRLLAVCQEIPGPVARAISRLARGIIDADASLLADGLEEMVSLGQALYVADDANVLLGALGHKERRRVVAAVTRVRAVEGAGPDAPGELSFVKGDGPAWLEQLTKREAQIAQRVITGMTNAAIARMSGVSVRTVEGHLYQVYSKLQVRNRQELTALDRACRSTVGAR